MEEEVPSVNNLEEKGDCEPQSVLGDGFCSRMYYTLAGRLRPKKHQFTCKYPNCPSRYYRGVENKHFFTFPKGETLRKWKEICNIPESVSCAHFKICEDHFLDTDFVNPFSKHRLKRFSVPTEFIFYENEDSCSTSEYHLTEVQEVKLEPEVYPIDVEGPFIQVPFLIECPVASTLHQNEEELESKVCSSNIDNAAAEVQDLPEAKPDQPNVILELQQKNIDTLPTDKPYFKSVKYKSEDDPCEICRICFRYLTNEEIIPLYGETSSAQRTEILHMLDEVLPLLDLEIFTCNVICTECLELVIRSYRLRKKWLQTDGVLQKIIETKKQKLNGKCDLLIVDKATQDSEEKVSSIDFDHCYNLTNVTLDTDEVGTTLKNLLTAKKYASRIDDWDFEPIGKSNTFLYYDLKGSDPLALEEDVSNDEQPKNGWWDSGSLLRNALTTEPITKKHRKKPNDVTKKPRKRPDNWWGLGPYMCELCGYISEEVKRFKNHLHRHKQKHKKPQIKKDKPKVTCHICGRGLVGSGALRRHLEIHKHLKCNICDKQLKTKEGLNRHIRVGHLGLPTYQCHLCGMKIADFSALRGHLESHSPVKKYACQLCDKRFARRVFLKRHIRTHSSDSVTCEYCNKWFKYKSSLETHVNTFHLNKGKYVCQVCNKSYWKNQDLKIHKVKVHGGAGG